jgi:hypothetical protein
MGISYSVKLSNSSIYQKPESIKIFDTATTCTMLSQEAHLVRSFFPPFPATGCTAKKNSSLTFTQSIEIQPLSVLALPLDNDIL